MFVITDHNSPVTTVIFSHMKNFLIHSIIILIVQQNPSRDLRGIDTNIIDNTDVLLTTKKLIKNDKSKIKQSVDTIPHMRCVTEKFKTILPSSKLFVSSIIRRNDKKYLNKKVRAINKEIKEFCAKNDPIFIGNSNITEKHLNKQNIHFQNNGINMLLHITLVYIQVSYYEMRTIQRLNMNLQFNF